VISHDEKALVAGLGAGGFAERFAATVEENFAFAAFLAVATAGHFFVVLERPGPAVATVITPPLKWTPSIGPLGRESWL